MCSNRLLNTKKAGDILSLRIESQRSPLLEEFTAEEQEKYFGTVRSKVIHNIDTLYYNVYLKEGETDLSAVLKDKTGEHGVDAMVAWLRELRDSYDPANPQEYDGMLYRPANRKCYRHAFVVDGIFDLLIAESLPNPNTPRFQVQLRSINLWAEGVKGSIERSFAYLRRLLKVYGLKFDRLEANRIDYAFHTNAVQNPSKFFGDAKLLKHLKSRMSMYQKVGRIGKEVSIDYLSLGRRSSNNVFFRAYNKTREVVEKGYKATFIPIWRDSKLISEYDKYVLEYAYKYRSFRSGIAIGKIEWYLEHGRDDDKRLWLLDLKEKYLLKSENTKALDKELDTFFPEVTQILNIEYQTMRKFYYGYRGAIKKLSCTVDERSPFFSLYQILDNRKSFLDVLTHSVVRFVKDRNAKKSDYLSWWKRIRSCKIVDSFGSVDMYRTYQRQADIESIVHSVAGKVGSVAVLSGYDSKGFAEDVCDLLAHFNDNDRSYLFAVDDDGVVSDNFEFAGDYREYDVLLSRKERQYRYLTEKEAPSPEDA